MEFNLEGAFAQETIAEYISQKEDMAYKNGCQKGYRIALSMLYESYEPVADDIKIIGLLMKYWGVSLEEANKDLFLEKRSFAREAVREHLQGQGKSEAEIQIYLEAKLDRRSDLWIFWRDPQRLVEELDKKEP